MGDSKGRIIFLAKYIADHADEEHPVTTETLISAVEEKGYSVNRNTIWTDIASGKMMMLAKQFPWDLEKAFQMESWKKGIISPLGTPSCPP